MPRNALLPAKVGLQKAFRIVPYLMPEEVKALTQEAMKRRNGQRDALLISVLYQTGLRVSEALSLTPSKIDLFEGKPFLRITGKGKKPRVVACPERLTDKLRAYAYEIKIAPEERLFPFNRQRAWQIIKEVSRRAGLNKNIWPHLLRHSDAIYRLRQTGNPKALQHHLGHSSTQMAMRYLSTLTQEDSLRIQQEVKFEED